MNKPKLLKKLSYRRILIIVVTVIGCLSIKKAIAHDHVSILFQPPPEDEQPEETEGAASRQTKRCAADSQLSQSSVSQALKLTAIAPQGNYGLTTLERPDLWIYLPETSAKQVILSIKKEGKTPHWQQSIELTGEAGVTGIKLADDAPALETGSNYQWAVILVCNERPDPNDPVVTSWIRRVVSKNSQSSPTSALEQVSIYAKEGIWYDALNLLISSKSSQANWQDLWREYLESAGLDKITDLPVSDNSLLPKR